MTEFDMLYESQMTRRKTKTERYPKDINLSPEFLEMLKCEYLSNRTDKKNYHSNFQKALSFHLDWIKDDITEAEKRIEAVTGVSEED